MGFQFTVEGDRWLLDRLRETPRQLSTAISKISSEFNYELPSIVISVFKEAIDSAGPAFPEIYARSLEYILRSSTSGLYTISSNGSYFDVELNLDALGTYDDLKEGFHFMAQLQSGGKLEDLPYMDEPLKNDLAHRLKSWNYLSASAIEFTFIARAAYWESNKKAPQWLLLNYGQPYPPIIYPFPIVEKIKNAMNYIVARTLRDTVDEVFYKEWGENYEITNPTVLTGEFKSRPGYMWVRKNGKMAGSMRI